MSATVAPGSTPHTDPVTLILDGIGAQTRARFQGRNATIGNSGVVHEVDEGDWIAGVMLPIPACHVGVSGWSINRLAPTDRDVTCLRCIRGASAPRSAPHLHGEQLEFAL